MNRVIYKLKELLLEGELKVSLEKGIDLIKEKKNNEEIFKLLIRLQNNENAFLKGLIGTEENRIEGNRILEGFLAILNKIEKKNSLAEMSFIIALDHYKNNEMQLALTKFDEAIEYNTYFEDAFLHRGMCYLKINVKA